LLRAVSRGDGRTLIRIFFRRRIAQASEYRDRRNIDAKLRRVVWSESDGLPGVIIDRYGDDFVLQTLTLAMDMRKDLITAAMVDLFGDIAIVERNDAPFARRRDWNYAAAFCAELHRKSRSKSKVWSSKSIFCADKDRFVSRSKAQLRNCLALRSRPARPGLLHKSGRICVDLCARRRNGSNRYRRKFGEHFRRETKRCAQ
jgi:Predicted SAM-dependent methyltransferases